MENEVLSGIQNPPADPLIESAIAFVRKVFEDEYSGHDFYHTLRVYRTALRIAQKERADIQTVGLIALLHDVDDRKLSPATYEHKDRAAGFLRSQGVGPVRIGEICRAIDQISFKGSDTVAPDTLEGRCVQDADRLDAMGAIGIARTFAYGGNHNRAIYLPEQKPNPHMNGEEYISSASSSLNHFYEKLFLLKDMMNTRTAKEIAEHRDRYMRDYVDEFLSEWNGC